MLPCGASKGDPYRAWLCRTPQPPSGARRPAPLPEVVSAQAFWFACPLASGVRFGRTAQKRGDLVGQLAPCASWAQGDAHAMRRVAEASARAVTISLLAHWVAPTRCVWACWFRHPLWAFGEVSQKSKSPAPEGFRTGLAEAASGLVVGADSALTTAGSQITDDD